MANRRTPGVVRTAITDTLRPLLPRGWKFFPYRVAPDAINSTTVWIRLQSIDKLPEAPQSGVHVVTYTVTVAVPDADPSDADARLDDDVIELVQALDLLPNIRRSTAQQVAVSDTLIGFDITVELVTYPVKNQE